MKRLIRAGAAILALAILTTIPLTSQPSAFAQPPAKEELPAELRFVPADAALFVHIDAAKIWDHPILKGVRKADPRTFDFLTTTTKTDFGIVPEDVKSLTVFIPKLKKPEDLEHIGVVLTFNKAFDKAKLTAGVEKYFGLGKSSVVAGDAKTAVVLLNLKEEYAKPQAADKTGPQSEAIKLAATGKFAAVAGLNLEAFPEELRGDDLPPQLRAFQPLFKARTLLATLDVEKNLTLDVRVKTGTAGQAVDCEKALGALLGLIQDELGTSLKEFETKKDANLTDLVAVLKAGIATTKSAKFSTLGNETRLTVTMPLDLPFGGAFVSARTLIQSQAAVAQSSNNMKQIGLAMHSFADSTNSMPPAAICDKKGTPLLSWRVSILPYIEQEKLYKEFKLDEPWDSENNKKLLAKMPANYAIPGKTKPGDTDTHYRVFVGNGAGFDWIRGARFPADFTDGTSNTLLCITAETAVPWTKPDELAYDPKQDPSKLFGLIVNGKCQVGMFDGSVRTLKKLPSKETLHALITRAGGEVIDEDFD